MECKENYCDGKSNGTQTPSCKNLRIICSLVAVFITIGIVLCYISTSNAKRVEKDIKLAIKLDLEVKEVEDRDLLKDVKTSFIPKNRDLNYGQIDWNDEYRSKRDTTSSIESIIDNQDTSKNGTQRRKLLVYYIDSEETPWKQPKQPGGMSQSDDVLDLENPHPVGETEETEIGTGMRKNRPIKPHSFWRDKLGPEEIREAQAKMMLQYMDRSVDPCDDFYLYACGNWAQSNPIPPDKAGYDTFEMLRESLDSVLRDLLLEKETYFDFHEATIDLNDNNVVFEERNNQFDQRQQTTRTLTSSDDAIIKAKNLYRSCMNYEILQQRGHTPLTQLLEMLGGWPMLDPNWDDTKFDWIALTAQLRLYNNDILISEWVGPDIKNSDEYVIQLDQTSLGLPTREYFLSATNSQYLDAYKDYLKRIALLLGASLELVQDEVKEIINFEIELARITASPEERRNVSELYRRLTIGELCRLTPQIDWVTYFTIILNRKPELHEPVVCFAMKYFQDLITLLAITPPRIVANYLVWRFVRHRVNNLDDRFQDAKQRFYFVLFGRERSPPRWQNCVAQVNSNMGMAVGSLFVQKYFDEVSKNDTLQMTGEIQQAYEEILADTIWLDDETRKLAVDKIDAMRLRIGYPDFILDRKQLAKRYYDIKIDQNTYFENTLSILKHLTRTEQGRLGQPVNKTLWNTAPAVVNAYYSRNKNQIMFPAGILQPPFYQRWFPRSLNYGGIGVVIGHEITHGFDDKGRLFDKDGNLQRWWTDEAIDRFHRRAQCLIEQYNHYTVQEVGMQVDGVNTQGENIADNGGIKQAFYAYTKWLQNHSDHNETLPGINATNTQLFFLNFAQVWCGAMRPEAIRNKLKTAVHSPGRYRVIGTLSNSIDFAREFNCPIGSPMNPLKKCTVW